MTPEFRREIRINDPVMIAHPNMEWYRDVYKDSKLWSYNSDPRGKTIIVYMFQGFGDIIQFYRYVVPFARYTKAKIICHCPRPLIRLFETSIEGLPIAFIDKDVDAPLPEHDYHVFLMDLLGYFEAIKIKIPNDPYLHVNTKKDLETDGFKIGVCWESSPFKDCEIRSCPLRYYKVLSDYGKLFCLQKERHQEKLLDDCKDLDLYGVSLNDFLDTAELVQALDLVVTVDTSVAHIAGAVGKRTIMMVTRVTDGRFDMEDDKSKTRWYPTMTVVRKGDDEDWGEVLKRIPGCF